MSRFVFPLSLPGFSANMSKRVYGSTQIQTAVSGKEWRVTYFSYPRTKYTIQLDFLRNASNYKELNRLLDLANRHLGAWDSFLFQDPEDCTALDQYIGTGDTVGLITAFQLQRVLDTFSDVAGGRQESYGRPTTNYLFDSGQVGSANWGFLAGTNAVLNVAIAPDGTTTATRITADLDTIHSYSQVKSIDVVHNYGPYAGSIFVRAVGSKRPVYVQVGLPSGSGATAWDPVVVSGNATPVKSYEFTNGSYFILNDSDWCRLGAVLNPYGASANYGTGTINLSVGTYPGHKHSLESIEVWGGQLERGSQIGPYVPTTGAAVTKNPVIWPAIGGGSEPIYELRSPAVEEFFSWPGDFGAARYQPQSAVMSGGLGVDRGAMDWQGKRSPYTGRINYFKSNCDFTTSVFTGSAGGTGTAPALHVVGVAPTAPDGDVSHYGSTMRFDRGAGTTSGDFSKLAQAIQNPNVPKSVPMVFSTWIQTASPGGVAVLDITEEISGATTTVTLDGLTPLKDCRFALPFVSDVTGNATISFKYRGNTNPTLQHQDIQLWGSMLETGDLSTSPTHVMFTQATALIEPAELPDGLTVRVWDDYAHVHGTRLSSGLRTNLSPGFISGSGAAGPDNGNTRGSSSGSTGTPVTPSGQGATPGALYTSSAYVNNNGSVVSCTFGVKLGSNTTDGTADLVLLAGSSGNITRAGVSVYSAYVQTLKAGWYRFVLVWTYSGSGSFTPYFATSGGAAATGFGMCELGITDGGFPFTAATQTDFVITNGLVDVTALPTPLRTDQFLTFTGGFYKRVRFDADDTGAADRLMNKIWKTGSIDLVSVKP